MKVLVAWKGGKGRCAEQGTGACLPGFKSRLLDGGRGTALDLFPCWPNGGGQE